MLIRSHLSHYAFDAPAFAGLCAQLKSGALEPERCRLSRKPAPLSPESPGVQVPAKAAPERRRAWRRSGLEALARGEIAVLLLCGGMATRFGNEAKGCFPLRPNATEPTFLSFKLAQIQALMAELGARVPVVIMDSFATRQQLKAHLDEIDWMQIPQALRHGFSQSIIPRVDAESKAPLVALEHTQNWPDRLLYCAPGHGDTLLRVQQSGVVAQLRASGVRHLLVSNVDNLAATLDPELAGAHLQGVSSGKMISVEAVARRPGEAGGCVAQLQAGPAIVESFRLPEGTALDEYPDFNTNTLWISLDALEIVPKLQWHPVLRKVPTPDGPEVSCVQFEQLIGEVSEHRPTQVLRVTREKRFLPIKRREDLQHAQARIDALEAKLSQPSQKA